MKTYGTCLATNLARDILYDMSETRRNLITWLDLRWPPLWEKHSRGIRGNQIVFLLHPIITIWEEHGSRVFSSINGVISALWGLLSRERDFIRRAWIERGRFRLSNGKWLRNGENNGKINILCYHFSLCQLNLKKTKQFLHIMKKTRLPFYWWS